MIDISDWDIGMVIASDDERRSMFEPSDEYRMMAPVWEECRDTNAGAAVIKSKGVKYLPPLDSHLAKGLEECASGHDNGLILRSGGFSTSGDSGRNRYEDYKNRATFYSAVGMTVDAFVNMLFRRSPSYPWTNPKDGLSMDVDHEFATEFLKNVSSYREDMNSFLERLVEEILVTNYVGVLEDRNANSPKSYSVLYTAEQIYDVHYGFDSEGYVVPDWYMLAEQLDGEDYRRMLLLDANGNYNVAVFQYDKTTKDWVLIEMSQPTYYPTATDLTPKPFKYIPFWVLSMRGRKARGIPPPRIHDLAEMALGYYRNSADRENEQHLVSIKTAIFPGWNIDEYGYPALGGGLASPPDSKPYIMEAKTESQLKEAMLEKVENCARLGSQILSGRGKYIQAKETAEINAGGDSCLVDAMAAIVTSAMNEVFKLKLQWTRVYDKEVSLSLNTQYFTTGLDANYLMALVKALQSKALSFDAYFAILEDANVYPDNWTKAKEVQGIENNPIPDFAAVTMEEGTASFTDIQTGAEKLENGVNGQTDGYGAKK